ncbi:MAG: hypothetical protein M0Z75_09755 [Nitrospiraceae bacterium]|nr:hypothetical protein [Nitrospiraceae bacterium]
MKRTDLTDQSGSLLIGLIITLVVITIAGAAVAYLTTGSTLAGLMKNNNLKAYYLAESGARFAMPLIEADLNNGNQNNMKALFGGSLTNTPTYTVSTGQFTLSVSNVNGTSATLTSIGSAGSGWLLTKREDIIRIAASSTPPYQGQSNFSDLNTNWNQTTNLGGPNLDGGKFIYDSKNNGLQYKNQGIPQLETGGLLTFSSSNPEVQSLWQTWLAYGSLSYELQEKVTVDNSKSNFFMIGLSFRVNEPATSTTPKSFYGVSFFRKDDTKFLQAPLWWWLLQDSKGQYEFDSLKNGTLYMVFWEYLANGDSGYISGSKQTCYNWLGNGCFYLLDYSPLTTVVTPDGKSLLADSAIVVRVLDIVSGGIHTNNISAYIAQSASSADHYYYPVSSPPPPAWVPSWPPSSQFAPVSNWYAYPSGKQTASPLIDNSLTPNNYFTNSTSEIGVNVFYDQNGTNGSNGGIKDLITDFGMSILSGSGSSGGQGTQYY